ncbi:MAG: 3',5'-cyclic adenosine monophosphate phosphodiesterase CpdA [Chlamydiia bacterium]|nr:3',5'-cyclic adenosine monophosphate phosphodiesterase CpdA [Chlamydiia bacterium]MCH9616090.1 3',5'-cyclic adenosine monophosphate phosphodiesterase CpdA [Chlamydiia bacterium]MCH9629487.1 3',5'-cyclic adenosine monophosphate phosphodiesterase CpdA [Chlamydiia bacterium]
MRLAHISDLHFGKVSLSPSQFFSKRWLGNLNLLLNRRGLFSSPQVYSLLNFFQKEGVTHVLITGDVSTTSDTREFEAARDFINALKRAGYPVYIIPGNHDHYTKRGYQNRLFYSYFPNQKLSTNAVDIVELENDWTLVLVDTACSTSLIASTGHFSPVIEEQLKSSLRKIPDNKKVILANHFPYIENEHPRRRLIRSKALKALLQTQPNIHLYLHGHTHRHILADLRESKLPITLDSGSVAHTKRGALNLIDLTASSTHIHSYFHGEKGWEKKKELKATC